MIQTASKALERALISLEGLSVGDAFGDQFFSPQEDYVLSEIESRSVPPPPWKFTDDSNMALSIVEILRCQNQINQDELAQSFAKHFDYHRKYGSGMFNLLSGLQKGKRWQKEVKRLFSGQGSFGNGAAMRVAPLGAYFADDLDRVVEQARLSAEVTHAHPEGIAGAIAVAVAAALTCKLRETSSLPEPSEFLDQVRAYVPDSIVREKIRHARNLAPGSSVQLAVAALGNGSQVTAQDTVPFALWCAAQQLNNYEEALWLTVSGLGDRDTTCAMVGGIVACYTGVEGIPPEWRTSRETLPDWPFKD